MDIFWLTHIQNPQRLDLEGCHTNQDGELVALVDSLGNGTLNEMQRDTVQALREAILSLARKDEIVIQSF
jgi:hypothetical protein